MFKALQTLFGKLTTPPSSDEKSGDRRTRRRSVRVKEFSPRDDIRYYALVNHRRLMSEPMPFEYWRLRLKGW